MPTYTFRCHKCDQEFDELVQRMGDMAPCPKCGGADVERVVSAPAARVGESLSDRLKRGSGCNQPPGSGFG